MRDYLSQIVARTKGIPESAPIKPAIQSRPASGLADVSNPFEEEAELMGGAEERELSPPRQTEPARDANSLIEDHNRDGMIPSSLPGFMERPPSDSSGQSDMPLHQPDRLLPRSSQAKPSEVLLSPPDEESEPPSIGERVSRVTEEAPQAIRDSESLAFVKPVSFEARATHRPPPAQDLRDQLPMESDEQDEPSLEQVEHSVSEPVAHELPASPSVAHEPPASPLIEDEQMDRVVDGFTPSSLSVDMPVPELRPKPPIDSTLFSIPKKDSTERRLIIGNLKVEVVPPPPVTTEQAPVRSTSRTARSQSRQEVSSSRDKLRFGLGQM